MTYIDKDVSLGDARAFIEEATLISLPSNATPMHVLVCVHGIRDDGAWGSAIKIAVQSGFVPTDITVVSARYDRVSSAGFIVGYKHKKNCDDLLSQLSQIRQDFPESFISIICHSSGTKVIVDIAHRITFPIEWIFLCGSVCRASDADKLRLRRRGLVNDAGTEDWWPIIAESLRPSRFSATGVGGFNRHPVIDRWFRYRHGDGLTQKHVDEWVIPTIINGRVRLVIPIDIGYKKHMPVLLRRGGFVGWVACLLLAMFLHLVFAFGLLLLIVIFFVAVVIFL